jgi:hypothetical protein
VQRPGKENGGHSRGTIKLRARVALCGVMVLAGIAACTRYAGPDIELIAETPGRVEYRAWCGAQACISQKTVTAMAEQHCAQNGLNARMTEKLLTAEDLNRGEHFVYRFDCAP